MVGPSPRPQPLLPLLLFSMVVLALEVLLTKILSYSVHTMLLYFVLGIAMLGFGAAGSLVSLRQGWLQPERLPRNMAMAALGSAAAFVCSFAVFVRLTPGLEQVDTAAFSVALVLTLPFLCAGTLVTLALAGAGPQLGRCYGANLVGSGLGCFVPVLLLGPLSGERLLGLLTLCAWGAGMLYLRAASPARGDVLWKVAGASGALCLGALVFAPQVFPVAPEPQGQVAVISRYAKRNGIAAVQRFDRWNATGRIQVFEYSNVPGVADPYPFMFYAQDSSAGSTLFQWDGRDIDQVQPGADRAGSHVSRLCTETLYAQAYFRPRSKVNIIGLGGGPDLQCALYRKARSVDVVEINPDAVQAVRGPFSQWLGGTGEHEHVRFHVQDGRSFSHGQRGTGFDLVQISGTDTKQSLASGRLTLAENHLYTREAFRDYLQSLSDTGVIAIIRFGEAEALRLANTAMAALRELGLQRPQDHITIFQNGVLFGVMVRRTPFEPDELATLQTHMRPEYFRGLSIFFYEIFEFPIQQPVVLRYTPSSAKEDSLSYLFADPATGWPRRFQEAYPFDISPTDDDRPFFFDVFRYDRAETWLQAAHVVTLRNLLASVLLLSVLLIVLPVRRMARGLQGGARFHIPLFFASIGLGFLLVEVWLLHRFAMFLGHQTYGLSVVLSTLLVGTGLGARLSEQFTAGARRRALVAVALLLAWLGLCASLLPSIMEASWSAPLPARAAIAVVFTLPAGLAMGQLMPAGLGWVQQRFSGAVAWCVGVNGFASVLATVVVIPISLRLGYTAVLLAGAALYLCAGAAAAAMSPSDP